MPLTIKSDNAFLQQGNMSTLRKHRDIFKVFQVKLWCRHSNTSVKELAKNRVQRKLLARNAHTIGVFFSDVEKILSAHLLRVGYWYSGEPPSFARDACRKRHVHQGEALSGRSASLQMGGQDARLFGHGQRHKAPLHTKLRLNIHRILQGGEVIAEIVCGLSAGILIALRFLRPALSSELRRQHRSRRFDVNPMLIRCYEASYE